WERFLPGDQVAGQRFLGEISTPFFPRGEKHAGDRVRSATPLACIRFLARGRHGWACARYSVSSRLLPELRCAVYHEADPTGRVMASKNAWGRRPGAIRRCGIVGVLQVLFRSDEQGHRMGVLCLAATACGTVRVVLPSLDSAYSQQRKISSVHRTSRRGFHGSCEPKHWVRAWDW
ncbi:unnamed protein product, partial [Ectocarpus fasciculatus]